MFSQDLITKSLKCSPAAKITEYFTNGGSLLNPSTEGFCNNKSCTTEDFLQLLLSIILGIWAANLAYACNDIGPEGRTLQWMYTIFAFLFAGIYLIYYYFSHYLANNLLVKLGYPIATTCMSGLKRLKETWPTAPPEYSEL